MSFLPITKEEMTARGWEAADFVYVSGDAYVDHPSFGVAIISRMLAPRCRWSLPRIIEDQQTEPKK